MANIRVFIDTNALPRHPSRLGTGFSRLCDLVENGVIEVFLSEVVVEEWKSQWLADIMDDYEKLNGSLHRFLRHPWTKELTSVGDLQAVANYLESIADELRGIANTQIQILIDRMQGNTINVASHHGANVMRDYFAGSSPFKKAKSREDIPDAFIFQCIIDLINEHGQVYCVVADKTMRESINLLEGVHIFDSINTFVQSVPVRLEARKVDPERAWQEMFNMLRPLLPTLENKLVELLKNNESYLDLLSYSEISHPLIPSDNSEALIEGIYEPNNITFDWTKTGDFGDGIISIPVSFESKADIVFDVYRGDAFSLPDEVWVDLEDPETHTFFDAGTSVNVKVDLSITIHFDWEEHVDEGFPEIKEVEVEEIYKVTILEDKYGRIF